MKICKKCGANNPEEARFCHKCGEDLESVNEQPNTQSEGSQVTEHVLGQDLIDNHQHDVTVKPESQESNDTVCPFCGASGCQPMQKSTTEIKNQGYKWGSGCCGMFLLGPVGLLCGLCGTGSTAKIENELWWTCTTCGKQHIALEDALKKWELRVAKLLPSSFGMGISTMIIKIIVRWLSDWLVGVGFLTSIIVFIFPIVFTIFILKIWWEELDKSTSAELGKSIDPYLTEEQEKTRLTNLLICAGVMLFMGYFGATLLDLLLSE